MSAEDRTKHGFKNEWTLSLYIVISGHLSFQYSGNSVSTETVSHSNNIHISVIKPQRSDVLMPHGVVKMHGRVMSNV